MARKKKPPPTVHLDWSGRKAGEATKTPIIIPATAPLAQWDIETSSGNKALTKALAHLDRVESKALKALDGPENARRRSPSRPTDSSSRSRAKAPPAKRRKGSA